MSTAHQQAGFVDPASLSLPSAAASPSSLKRYSSVEPERDDSPEPSTSTEPPRKRPRSAVTPEERKEARAHRNRIAAQNSRDRRKAQFSYLERRVTELEEENRRLRAGIPAPPEAPTSDSDGDCERKSEDDRREQENQELRERIRSLEKGYEAVVKALAAQGTVNATSSGAGPSSSSSAPLLSSAPSPAPSQPIHAAPSPASSADPSSLLSSAASLSPTHTNSTLVDSPSVFPKDSFDFSLSPVFTLNTINDTTTSPLGSDLSQSHAPARHLARMATTNAHVLVPQQRVGSTRLALSRPLGQSCSAVSLSMKTKQRQMQPSRSCSLKYSRRRRVALAHFLAMALRHRLRSRRQ
ncbi:hypothetical protein CONPUDRAFT_81252 [Coniophora puteana RWD-64-598 SS2]|uniref:X-box-binding protein 1 n=1 Tax=Coniophora puteana (strain RWD-64-598) TaxID=741705 RepID=A0A5M3MVN8_CONPW|nr:uncharacterized protein CONPUDRAFT_81252 [Coniophora puteana RWD-64-598 SS2]EIW83228.1 hypothetical protein CONPUDRAFT_81252 [Coniophora puteana RWD-64-598 SS2]